MLLVWTQRDSIQTVLYLAGETILPNKGMNAKGPGLDEYETPPWLFRALDTEFGFNMDGAASEKNHLLPNWTDDVCSLYDKEFGELLRVFCNPPYSNIDPFVDVALYRKSDLWVFLLPARVNADWYRRLYESTRVEWRPLRKRIQFLVNGKVPLNEKTGKPQGPRFGSIVAVVRPT